MLRGCVFALLLLASVIAGYFYWLDQVFEPPGSYIGAGVIGFLVTCCIGALDKGRVAWRDISYVAHASHGMRMEEGREVAVCGPIHPLGEPLRAPFSHVPCVMCEYDVLSRRRTKSRSSTTTENPGSDFAGFLMVPCAVRTPLGDVKILGFPQLDETNAEASAKTCHGYGAACNARHFLKTTEFEDRSGFKFVSVLSVFGEIWTDDDGLVQKNMRLGQLTVSDLYPPADNAKLEELARAEAAELSDADDDDDDGDDEVLDEAETPAVSLSNLPVLKEKRVAVGEEVCVIGVYNEMRGGLLPRSSGSPNRLLRGTPEELDARLRLSFYRLLIGGAFGLLAINAAIVGVMILYQRSPDTIRHQQREAERAVKKGDLPRLANLVRRGLDANFRDSSHRTLLMQAKDPAISAWLIAHDVDVNATDDEGETALTAAARAGRTEIVQQLITAGAHLNPKSKSLGTTPLQDAEMRGHEATAKLLRDAGAK